MFGGEFLVFGSCACHRAIKRNADGCEPNKKEISIGKNRYWNLFADFNALKL
jgi:hypothetical protein